MEGGEDKEEDARGRQMMMASKVAAATLYHLAKVRRNNISPLPLHLSLSLSFSLLCSIYAHTHYYSLTHSFTHMHKQSHPYPTDRFCAKGRPPFQKPERAGRERGQARRGAEEPAQRRASRQEGKRERCGVGLVQAERRERMRCGWVRGSLSSTAERPAACVLSPLSSSGCAVRVGKGAAAPETLSPGRPWP